MGKNKKKNPKLTDEPSKKAVLANKKIDQKSPTKQNGTPEKKKLEKSVIVPDSNAKPVSKNSMKNSKKKKIGNLKDGKQETKEMEKETIEVVKTDVENPMKLNKRAKTRVKTQLKKDLILKGKTNVLLNNINLLQKKLIKLKAKPEPHSKKALRKMQLIQSLIEKAKTEGVITKEPTKKESGESETAKPEKTKKDKKPTSTPALNGKNTAQNVSKPPQKENQIQKNLPKQKTPQNNTTENISNQFVVFVGNLPVDIKKPTLLEHFGGIEGLEKIRIPKLKKKKKRAFAYIQFASEESKKKALELHRSLINEIPINVLHADRKTGKKNNQGENAKLEPQQNQQKAASNVTDKQLMKVGKKIQKTHKQNKKHNAVGVKSP